ncbi:hypothetical protein L207DRAFT_11785 [Hyaloscypha variabilis F]|uniref:Uncharacterized protein n=1 Tax=Hyaloscypha variabilis (strain UAMH 11265 / GT02V1 / F) TaxID=1149755 RepID=A0A2J6SCY0_HYAVF|nr:hypothetical protein L207DRAFT_11785 [Hyaloscypha variabilis F]
MSATRRAMERRQHHYKIPTAFVNDCPSARPVYFVDLLALSGALRGQPASFFRAWMCRGEKSLASRARQPGGAVFGQTRSCPCCGSSSIHDCAAAKTRQRLEISRPAGVRIKAPSAYLVSCVVLMMVTVRRDEGRALRRKHLRQQLPQLPQLLACACRWTLSFCSLRSHSRPGPRKLTATGSRPARLAKVRPRTSFFKMAFDIGPTRSWTWAWAFCGRTR